MSWDTLRGEWVGPDIVDFEPKKPPDYQPDWSENPEGMEALGGDCPFIMIADGKASLFTPSGLKDAPVPAHYEPVESPVKNPLYRQQSSPVAKIWERPDNRLHAPADPRFPYALTTYRLTVPCGRHGDALGTGRRRVAAGSVCRNLPRTRRLAGDP